MSLHQFLVRFSVRASVIFSVGSILVACVPAGAGSGQGATSSGSAAISASLEANVVAAGKACLFNGKTVNSGSSVLAYQSSSVAFGLQCVSQQRLCTDGVLSGSFAFASCAVAPPPANALYVAPLGKDTNPGSLALPLKTINRAAELATAGRTVFVRGGTYFEKVFLGNSGTVTAPITFRSYPGETVIINGSTWASRGASVVSIAGSYISFEGFQVVNSVEGEGISVDCVHDVSVLNNLVSNIYSTGIVISCSSEKIGFSKNNLVRGNTVVNAANSNKDRLAGAGWGQGITVRYSENVTVARNHVYQNYGEGIGALQSQGTVVSGHTVHDNYSVEIYLDNAPNTAVFRNFIFNTGNPNFLLKGTQRAISIGVAKESYSSVQLPNSYQVIVNNIAVGGRFGFYYGNYDLGGGMTNGIVANNTFVNATDANIYIDPDSGHSQNLLVNNIVFRSTPGLLVDGSPAGFALGNNCWFGGSMSGFGGAGDQALNPRFQNAGALYPGAYQLQTGSVCATSGRQLGAVPLNFAGVPRVAPFSSGAY